MVSKIAWGILWTFIRELKSLKGGTLVGSFCPKDIVFQLKNLIGIMHLDTVGNDAKFEEKLILGSKNDMRNLENFNASSGKSENLHLMRHFCREYILF